MSDLTVSTAQLVNLHKALIGIEVLSPPPTPKGRYVLAKAAPKVEAAALVFYKQESKLIEEHAKKDEAGKLISREVTLPSGEKAKNFELADGEAYAAAKQSLLDEPVVLSGIRPITRAELGACPITVQHEKWLTGTLLLDEEPTE